MQSDTDVLSRRQEALVSLIFTDPTSNEGALDDQISKGLKIYQNNLLMTAVRALSLKYPVLEKMIGREALSALTKKLIRTELPDTGDWADWGEHLSALIMTTELHDEHPYLAEVASFEWYLHQTARGLGTELDVNSLARLSHTDLENVFIELSGTLRVLNFQYPVDEIWLLHQLSKDQINSSELSVYLSKPTGAHHIVIYQRESVPCVERLTQQENAWLVDVIAGFSLEVLLEKHEKIDLSDWLSVAIEEQWLKGLR